jgi:hypothetical protein
MITTRQARKSEMGFEQTRQVVFRGLGKKQLRRSSSCGDGEGRRGKRGKGKGAWGDYDHGFRLDKRFCQCTSMMR